MRAFQGLSAPTILKNIIFSFSSKIFVAFVEDNATISSIRYFENHVSYFMQKEVDPTKFLSDIYFSSTQVYN